jgi:hypothetical protein
LDDTEKTVLAKCGRSLAHLRAEIDDRRFGLVLGAGVSKPLNFPSWSELVDRIAKHADVDGEHVVAGAGSNLPDTSKTQMLFQHYKSKVLDLTSEPITAKFERRIQGQWRRIIQDCLYKGVPETAKDLKDKHPYLRYLMPVIAKPGMTVNYNFDDTIQQILLLESPHGTPNSVRGFETVSNASLSFRPDSTILHHPNGFLPRNLLEHPSENLIFSDHSFADQLIESMAGYHSSLLHHFSKTTCVFIGLSLHDATLRHLLRQSAIINPGHYHYYVHWQRPGVASDPAAESALRDANFEVYNLVTLFLRDDEIAAFGRLLAMPETDLRREAEEIGVHLKYFYYLTGAIGAGKTTCLSYFGSFKTYEEWAEPRPAELKKAWKDLSDDERTRLDQWIIHQFDLKNHKLLDRRIGIHVIDRTPLDPLAFTETSDIKKKAGMIAQGLSPGMSARRPQDGHIILLTGAPDDMEARAIGRHKQSPADVIREMQQQLKQILDGFPVTAIDTLGLSIPQVVKRVAQTILLETYSPVDLSALLRQIECNGIASVGLS